jgi:flagellar basal body-associated protein FliL
MLEIEMPSNMTVSTGREFEGKGTIEILIWIVLVVVVIAIVGVIFLLGHQTNN